jgi:hypothetical protein
MVSLKCRSIAALALTLVCAWPIAAHADASWDSHAAPASSEEGALGGAFCFSTASGEAACALSEACNDLTACTQDSDCAAGMACAVNTCCDTPSPNVCVPLAPGFVCPATGPFSCSEPTFFPPCVATAPPQLAPTLSAPLLAIGLLLLTGIGLLALRSVRRA